MQAAPSLTSPGSSGWLDSKAAPPRLLAPTAGGRLCLLGHAELSLWGEEGGGTTTGDPWHSTGSPEDGGGRGSDRDACPTSPCPNFTRGCWHRRSGGGGVVEQTGPEGSAATRPVQPAPPAGLSGIRTWHIGPAGCREGKGGGRAGHRSADVARRIAVLCGADGPAVGARGWDPLC